MGFPFGDVIQLKGLGNYVSAITLGVVGSSKWIPTLFDPACKVVTDFQVANYNAGAYGIQIYFPWRKIINLYLLWKGIIKLKI